MLHQRGRRTIQKAFLHPFHTVPERTDDTVELYLKRLFVIRAQGLRITFDGGGRAVLRLSGTGTEGATLRVYLEQYVDETGNHTLTAEAALESVAAAVQEITAMQQHLGRIDPDVKT